MDKFGDIRPDYTPDRDDLPRRRTVEELDATLEKEAAETAENQLASRSKCGKQRCRCSGSCK